MGGDDAPAQDLGALLNDLRYALQPAAPTQSELHACRDAFAAQESSAALSLAAELLATSSCSHEELGSSVARCVTRIALSDIPASPPVEHFVTPVQKGVVHLVRATLDACRSARRFQALRHAGIALAAAALDNADAGSNTGVRVDILQEVCAAHSCSPELLVSTSPYVSDLMLTLAKASRPDPEWARKLLMLSRCQLTLHPGCVGEAAYDQLSRASIALASAFGADSYANVGSSDAAEIGTAGDADGPCTIAAGLQVAVPSQLEVECELARAAWASHDVGPAPLPWPESMYCAEVDKPDLASDSAAVVAASAASAASSGSSSNADDAAATAAAAAAAGITDCNLAVSTTRQPPFGAAILLRATRRVRCDWRVGGNVIDTASQIETESESESDVRTESISRNDAKGGSAADVGVSCRLRGLLYCRERNASGAASSSDDDDADRYGDGPADQTISVPRRTSFCFEGTVQIPLSAQQRRKAAQAAKAAAAAAKIAALQWACPACTTLNEQSRTVCQTCGAAKPKAKSPQEAAGADDRGAHGKASGLFRGSVSLALVSASATSGPGSLLGTWSRGARAGAWLGIPYASITGATGNDGHFALALGTDDDGDVAMSEPGTRIEGVRTIVFDGKRRFIEIVGTGCGAEKDRLSMSTLAALGAAFTLEAWVCPSKLSVSAPHDSDAGVMRCIASDGRFGIGLLPSGRVVGFGATTHDHMKRATQFIRDDMFAMPKKDDYVILCSHDPLPLCEWSHVSLKLSAGAAPTLSLCIGPRWVDSADAVLGGENKITDCETPVLLGAHPWSDMSMACGWQAKWLFQGGICDTKLWGGCSGPGAELLLLGHWPLHVADSSMGVLAALALVDAAQPARRLDAANRGNEQQRAAGKAVSKLPAQQHHGRLLLARRRAHLSVGTATALHRALFMVDALLTDTTAPPAFVAQHRHFHAVMLDSNKGTCTRLAGDTSCGPDSIVFCGESVIGAGAIWRNHPISTRNGFCVGVTIKLDEKLASRQSKVVTASMQFHCGSVFGLRPLDDEIGAATGGCSGVGISSSWTDAGATAARSAELSGIHDAAVEHNRQRQEGDGRGVLYGRRLCVDLRITTDPDTTRTTIDLAAFVAARRSSADRRLQIDRWLLGRAWSVPFGTDSLRSSCVQVQYITGSSPSLLLLVNGNRALQVSVDLDSALAMAPSQLDARGILWPGITTSGDSAPFHLLQWTSGPPPVVRESEDVFCVTETRPTAALYAVRAANRKRNAAIDVAMGPGTDSESESEIDEDAECNTQHEPMSSDDDPSQSPGPAAEGTESSGFPADGAWSCLTCTMSNASARTICSACGTPRSVGPGENTVSVAQAEGWNCPTCTMRNSASSTTCSMCQTPRPELNGQTKLLGGGKGGVSDIDSRWACAQCTVLNSASSTICSVCQAPRQPLQEVQAFNLPEGKAPDLDPLSDGAMSTLDHNTRPSNPIAATLQDSDVPCTPWTCTQCTFAGNTGLKCTMCGADKPKEPILTSSSSTAGSATTVSKVDKTNDDILRRAQQSAEEHAQRLYKVQEFASRCRNVGSHEDSVAVDAESLGGLWDTTEGTLSLQIRQRRHQSIALLLRGSFRAPSLGSSSRDPPTLAQLSSTLSARTCAADGDLPLHYEPLGILRAVAFVDCKAPRSGMSSPSMLWRALGSFATGYGSHDRRAHCVLRFSADAEVLTAVWHRGSGISGRCGVWYAQRRGVATELRGLAHVNEDSGSTDTSASAAVSADTSASATEVVPFTGKQRAKVRIVPAQAGLANMTDGLTNVCYQNSLLQALFATDALRDRLLAAPLLDTGTRVTTAGDLSSVQLQRTDSELARELGGITGNAADSEAGAVAAHVQRLFAKLLLSWQPSHAVTQRAMQKSLPSDWRTGRQQDAADFASFLVEMLASALDNFDAGVEVGATESKDHDEGSVEAKTENQNFDGACTMRSIADMFGGSTVAVLRCTPTPGGGEGSGCGHVTAAQPEQFREHMLNLHDLRYTPIVDLTVVASGDSPDVLPPPGFEKLNCDLSKGRNHGPGNAPYIFLCTKRAPSVDDHPVATQTKTAITDIVLRVVDSSASIPNMPGYERASVQLNASTIEDDPSRRTSAIVSSTCSLAPDTKNASKENNVAATIQTNTGTNDTTNGGKKRVYLFFKRDDTGSPITDLAVIYDDDPTPDGFRKDSTDLNQGTGSKVFLCYRQDMPLHDIRTSHEGLPGFTFIDRSLCLGSAQAQTRPLYLLHSDGGGVASAQPPVTGVRVCTVGSEHEHETLSAGYAPVEGPCLPLDPVNTGQHHLSPLPLAHTGDLQDGSGIDGDGEDHECKVVSDTAPQTIQDTAMEPQQQRVMILRGEGNPLFNLEVFRAPHRAPRFQGYETIDLHNGASNGSMQGVWRGFDNVQRERRTVHFMDGDAVAAAEMEGDWSACGADGKMAQGGALRGIAYATAELAAQGRWCFIGSAASNGSRKCHGVHFEFKCEHIDQVQARKYVFEGPQTDAADTHPTERQISVTGSVSRSIFPGIATGLLDTSVRGGCLPQSNWLERKAPHFATYGRRPPVLYVAVVTESEDGAPPLPTGCVSGAWRQARLFDSKLGAEPSAKDAPKTRIYFICVGDVTFSDGTNAPAPIEDIMVKSEADMLPDGFVPIMETPSGQGAALCGNTPGAVSLFLCFKRSCFGAGVDQREKCRFLTDIMLQKGKSPKRKGTPAALRLNVASAPSDPSPLMLLKPFSGSGCAMDHLYRALNTTAVGQCAALPAKSATGTPSRPEEGWVLHVCCEDLELNAFSDTNAQQPSIPASWFNSQPPCAGEYELYAQDNPASKWCMRLYSSRFSRLPRAHTAAEARDLAAIVPRIVVGTYDQGTPVKNCLTGVRVPFFKSDSSSQTRSAADISHWEIAAHWGRPFGSNVAGSMSSLCVQHPCHFTLNADCSEMICGEWVESGQEPTGSDSRDATNGKRGGNSGSNAGSSASGTTNANLSARGGPWCLVKDNYVTIAFKRSSGSLWQKGEEVSSERVSQLSIQSLLRRSLSNARSMGAENRRECANCGQRCETTERVVLRRAPRYLVVTLKRMWFDWRANRTVKMLQHVSFESWLQMPGAPPREELPPDLADALHGDMSASGAVARAEPVYGVYAVVVHTGLTANSGHYYAFCRSASARGLWRSDVASAPWVKFNDNKVTQSSWSDMMDHLGAGQCNSAYLVFYRRLDDEEARDFRQWRRRQDTATSGSNIAKMQVEGPSEATDEHKGECGDEDDDAAMLAAALALSQQPSPHISAEAEAADARVELDSGTEADSASADDMELAAALALSMAASPGAPASPPVAPEAASPSKCPTVSATVEAAAQKRERLQNWALKTLEDNEAFVRDRLGAASSDLILHELELLTQMRASSADGGSMDISNWAESVLKK